MGKYLGAYLSDNLLNYISRESKGKTAERGDGGAQERWRMGIGTLEHLASRQKVSGSGKSILKV